MKRFFGLLCCFFLCAGLHAQTIDPQCQDGVLYVRLTPDFPMNTLHFDDQDLLRASDLPMFSALFGKYGVNLLLRPFHLFGNEALLRTIEVHFDRMEAIDSFLLELQQSEWVALAEKVPFMRVLGAVNDPYYGTVSGRNWKWHLDMIKADSAWMIQTGKAHVKVAVVDNFVWEGHPDLDIDSANLCTVSYSRTNGYEYTVGTASPPSTIAQGSSEKAYYASHGTHCAGLVGATNNNQTGIASIGGGVTLMGVSSTTAQYPQAVIYGMQGVQWAAEHGANVISMSFGGATGAQTYQTLMQACYDAGIVLVAAAGNEGDGENKIIYPGGLPTVISVASVDGDGKISYFSQWGEGRADIAAPGGFIVGKSQYPNILSTTFCTAYLARNMGFSGTYYDGMQGTSMACPVTAGLVGLLLSKDSTLTPDAIKLRLQRTAHPLNAASEHTIDGYGYIDAYAALKYQYLLVSEDTLEFSKETGAQRRLKVESSKPWKLSGLPEWLSVSAAAGDSGTKELVFTTLSENSNAGARMAVLTIKGEGGVGEKQVVVSQADFRFVFSVDPKTVTLAGSKGAADTLHLHATVKWSLLNESSWLASTIQQVDDDSAIIVLTTRSSNSWGRNRETALLFDANGLDPDTVYVMQRMADFISMSTTLANIGPAAGDTVSVRLYSNVHWTISGGDSSWIVPDRTEGVDSATLLFTVQQDNTTGAVRSAVFTITDGSITRSLTIRQQHNLSLKEAAPAALQIYP
ncbi:MAG: S8 family serine peptidase, partial [Bacteroidales bacterium]|nr:S8 family serine peptidase [Bacteroidales bacterium]